MGFFSLFSNFRAPGHTPGKSDISAHTAGTAKGEEWVQKKGREPGRDSPLTARTGGAIRPASPPPTASRSIRGCPTFRRRETIGWPPVGVQPLRLPRPAKAGTPTDPLDAYPLRSRIRDWSPGAALRRFAECRPPIERCDLCMPSLRAITSISSSRRRDSFTASARHVRFSSGTNQARNIVVCRVMPKSCATFA